jgi:hypothetical protein
MAILGILFWKLGPWNNRQRILSYEFPEGWQVEIEQTISSFHEMTPTLKKKLQKGIQVLMAEKQWHSAESGELIHRYKLKSLILGAWVGACSKDPYFKNIENMELGVLSSHYTLSIQYDSNGIYSHKWFQPELVKELGIDNFSFKYRGVLAEWAANMTYQQNVFTNCLDHIHFDLSLFPLLFEVYLTDSESLKSSLPKLVDFYDDFLRL